MGTTLYVDCVYLYVCLEIAKTLYSYDLAEIFWTSVKCLQYIDYYTIDSAVNCIKTGNKIRTEGLIDKMLIKTDNTIGVHSTYTKQTG